MTNFLQVLLAHDRFIKLSINPGLLLSAALQQSLKGLIVRYVAFIIQSCMEKFRSEAFMNRLNNCFYSNSDPNTLSKYTTP